MELSGRLSCILTQSKMLDLTAMGILVPEWSLSGCLGVGEWMGEGDITCSNLSYVASRSILR